MEPIESQTLLRSGDGPSQHGRYLWSDRTAPQTFPFRPSSRGALWPAIPW